MLQDHAGAAAWRCGYPTDSSDLAAGATGSTTSTPSLLQRRLIRGLRLKSSPVPAGSWNSPGMMP